MAHRPDPAREGGVHGLQGHAVEVDAESAMVEAHRNGTGATVEVEAANGHHHGEAQRRSSRCSPGPSSWRRHR